MHNHNFIHAACIVVFHIYLYFKTISLCQCHLVLYHLAWVSIFQSWILLWILAFPAYIGRKPVSPARGNRTDLFHSINEPETFWETCTKLKLSKSLVDIFIDGFVEQIQLDKMWLLYRILCTENELWPCGIDSRLGRNRL